MIDTDWATTVPAARAGSSETVHVVGLVTPPESKEGVVHLVQETMGAKRNGDVHQRGVLFTVASGSDAAKQRHQLPGFLCARAGAREGYALGGAVGLVQKDRITPTVCAASAHHSR